MRRGADLRRTRSCARPIGRGVLVRCAALVLSAACGGGLGAPPASAQVVAGAWKMDERVVVTDFQRVTALARSPDRLFIATDGGLAVLRDAFGRWELPVTREDGYPDRQVLALGWDARDASLWMATRDGRLLQLDVDGRRWIDSFSLRQAVDRIIAPAADPSRLLLRSGGRWTAFDPFMRDTERVSSAEVQAAIDADFDLRERAELLADPSWEAARTFLGRRDSRRYEVTDVMPSAEAPGEFWVATYGGFLERYDRFSGRADPIDYGIVGYGTAAVHVDRRSGRLWFAPRRPSDRYGVGSTDPALQEWTAWAGAVGGFEHRGAPDAPVQAWLSTESGVLAGGDRGLYRYDGERWRSETMGSREDVAPVTALAETGGERGGAWVGTGRGLLRIPAPGAEPDVLLLRAEPIRALASHGGTVWVGTDTGLVRLDADARPVEAAGPPGRVGALASDGRRLVAGIERDVWILEEGADWTRAAPLGVLGSSVTALAARNGVVWIGTSEELIAWQTDSDRITTYTFAAGDLPTSARGERAVFDLAVEADGAVWVATPAGAVRMGPER